MRIWGSGLFAVPLLALAGCVNLPPLEQDGVAVSEIVQRIKCELAFSSPDTEGSYPTGAFQWMRYWTAKVDLTLETTDTSALSPNMTFVDPMTSVFLKGIGTITRSFTFGAGGNIGTAAYRNDKVSFTLSMKELAAMRHRECQLPEERGLLGNLGLQDWMSSALAPVANKQLTIGYHQPPTGKATPIPSPFVVKAEKPSGPSAAGGRPSELDKFKAKKKQIDDVIDAALTSIRSAEDKVNSAQVLAKQTAQIHKEQIPSQSWIQSTYNLAMRTAHAADGALDDIEQAKEDVWKAKTMTYELKKEIEDRLATFDPAEQAHDPLYEGLKQLQTAITAILANNTGRLADINGRAKDASDLATNAKQTALDAWNLLPRDPPLDSVAHSVRFTVSVSANVTPNWTLVSFKGPGQSSPFASAQRLRVHTLDIVLGEPAEAGGKALSDEQNRQLLNQKFDRLEQLSRFNNSDLLFVPLQ